MLCLHCVSHGSVIRTKYCPIKFAEFSFCSVTKINCLRSITLSNKQMDAYLLHQVWAQTGLFRPLAFVVVTLRSYACLWKCRVWGRIFHGDTFACLLLNTGGEGGCQGKLSYCYLNRRQVFSLGLFFLTDLIFDLSWSEINIEELSIKSLIQIPMCLIAQYHRFLKVLMHICK